jgi:hypothetical protein
VVVVPAVVVVAPVVVEAVVEAAAAPLAVVPEAVVPEAAAVAGVVAVELSDPHPAIPITRGQRPFHAA